MLNSNKFPSGNRENSLYSELLNEFLGYFCEKWDVPGSLQKSIQSFLLAQSYDDIASSDERKRILVKLADEKFGLSDEVLQRLYNAAALDGVYPTPTEKHELREAYLNLDPKTRRDWLKRHGLPLAFEGDFKFVSAADCLAYASAQLSAATVKRSDARKDVQEERRGSILRSLLGGWIFRIFPSQKSVAYFDEFKSTKTKSYIEYLRTHYPKVIHRDCAHVSIRIPREYWAAYSAQEITDWACACVGDAYRRLSNHTYLSVYIEKPEGHPAKDFWALVADISLYAERHIEEPHLKGYFKPHEIEQATIGHVKTLKCADAQFDLLSYGFGFKDCFVLTDRPLHSEGETAETTAVLLVFEKNQADETPIPCPACYSLDVRGNSYPVFGVKSWECHNSLCPERSAFDRGHRYSVLGELRKHSSILTDAVIPSHIIKKWKLDVVHASASEAAEMLVTFFTLPNDRLYFANWDKIEIHKHSRKLELQNSEPTTKHRGVFKQFRRHAFFKRFLHPASRLPGNSFKPVKHKNKWLTLYNGSCLDVLPTLRAASVDGAVTSPPYYNAREYSVWPNIYAYLYDMKIAAEGIFHVLKPGAYYAFNIFDYFDNENSFALSSLGKKRLILSAYMAEIFRHVGFNYVGNVVWFKGHVEGKRNYNRGNNVPFFQLPLNAWEHVMILRKPGRGAELAFPDVLYTRPVVKMVKGQNTHGHTAPFPQTIPDLLCSRLPRASTVIDPFGGSLTTARACLAYDQNSVAVELHRDYCDLGLEKLEQERDLFS